MGRSGPREALHDRGELVNLADHDRGDPQLVTHAPELLDEAVNRVDEDVRRFEEVLRADRHAASLRDAVGDLLRLAQGRVGDADAGDGRVGVELERTESVAGGL